MEWGGPSHLPKRQRVWGMKESCVQRTGFFLGGKIHTSLKRPWISCVGTFKRPTNVKFNMLNSSTSFLSYTDLMWIYFVASWTWELSQACSYRRLYLKHSYVSPRSTECDVIFASRWLNLNDPINRKLILLVINCCLVIS